MRVIERQMNDAVYAQKDWKCGNTRVEKRSHGGVAVLLHGNHIATVHGGTMQFTLAGWNTPTTRSRVNALLARFAMHNARVFCKKFTPYLSTHGHVIEIDSRQWCDPSLYPIPVPTEGMM